LLIALALLHVVPGRLFQPPLRNTDRGQFDAILVLGFPADDAGQPTPILRDRVEAAAAAWHRGAAPYVIVSGGAAHNRFVEADVMATLAMQLGVPADRVVAERQAMNTVENLARAVEIMQARGWRSLLVMSSAAHVPRAAWIASHFPIEYATEGTASSGGGSLLWDLAATEWEHAQQLRILLRGDARVPGG
jgi:uncharacterized SAM-binding protein YcdF (DUF218 family)